MPTSSVTKVKSAGATRPRRPRRAPVWTLRLLADPALLSPTGQIHPLERRAAALFALVALEAGISRQRVALLLWPDSEANQARQALRQQILRVRRATGVELLVGTAALQLAPELRTDLDAGSAGGCLLGDHDYSDSEELARWVAQQRQRRSSTALASGAQRVADAETAGDLDEALRAAQELLAVDDTDEGHHRSVMRLRYLRGDAAGALLAYERLRALLEREYRALPSSDTEALAQTIRGATSLSAPANVKRPPPPALLRPPRLVGRVRELATVARVWQSDRVVVLVGEAGLGKSRLLAELAQLHPPCVGAQARPGDANTPYASLARLLRAVIGERGAVVQQLPRQELASLLPEVGVNLEALPDGRRLWLQSAVESVLRAASADGVHALLFDDLHFADPASLEMLQLLLQSDVATGLRWGLALRPASDDSPSARLLEALEETGRGELLPLGPLDRSALEELISSLGLAELDATSLAPQLARHTGGNPLFALETLKSVWSQGARTNSLPSPGSVATLIERRLRQLSSQALSLARVAAIAAVDFTIEMAEEVLEIRALAFADAWRELESAQILRGGAFAHDLVFEATLASIPDLIARHTHGAVARHLEQQSGEPSRIARHWINAGQPTRALRALHQAADAAREAMRPREQAQFLEQAAAIERDAGDGEAAFSSLRAATAARFMVDRSDLDDEALERVLAAATTPRERGAALELRCEVLLARGDYEAVSACVDEALTLVDADPAARCELLQVKAGALSLRGDFARALQVMQEVAPWIEAHGSGSQRAALHGDLAVVLDNADRPLDAQAHHRQALTLCSEQDDHTNAVIILSNLAVSLSHTGHLEQATDTLMRGERLAAAHDDVRGAAWPTPSMLSRCLRDRSHYDEALRWGEIGLREIQAQAPSWLPAFHVHMANLYLHLGQHTRARQSLGQVGAADLLPPWQQAALWLAHSRLQRALGNPFGDAARTALAAASETGRRTLHAAVTLEHAQTLPPAEALQVAQTVLAQAQACQLSGVALSAQIWASGFALACGDVEAAVRHAEAALAVTGDMYPDELYRGELWWRAGRAFEAAGDSGRAARNDAEGAAWVQKIAAQHVPPEFRDSFLNRNPVNRDLLAAARRGTIRVA